MNRLPPMLGYTLARIVLFAIPFGLLIAIGFAPIWALLIAFVLSSLVSIFALNRQRNKVSESLVARRERLRTAMAERTAAEDAWDDAQRASSADSQVDSAADPGVEPTN